MSTKLRQFEDFDDKTEFFYYLRRMIGRCQMKSSEQCTNKPDLVHHINENPDYNDLSNLTISCYACHNRYHRYGKSGKPLSDEHKQKISEANSGKTFTTQHRLRISKALKRYHEQN